jgi:hypothetical protein
MLNFVRDSLNVPKQKRQFFKFHMTNKYAFRLFTENNLFLLACLLCGLPVWLPHFPPMVDLPQHAAQISLLLNLTDPNFRFSDEFKITLFTPYLLGYVLIAVATPLLGILAACKLIIWLALAAFALSSRILLRWTGADEYWSWLTFPVMYGFTYQWGFLNFLIGAPIGIFFLALIWRQRESESKNVRTPLFIAFMLYVLFFSHALILALFSLIATAYWVFSTKKFSDLIKFAWPLVTLCPVVIIWMYLNTSTSSPFLMDLTLWADNNYWGRFRGFMPRLLGEQPSLKVTMFGIFIFALPFLSGGRITKSKLRYIPILIMVLFLSFFPVVMFGGTFNYQRFAFISMPLFLLLVDKKSSQNHVCKLMRLMAPVIAFAWIAHISLYSLNFQRNSRGFESVLSKIEPGKRIASLVFDWDDDNSMSPVFLHFPVWYSALKNGIVDPSISDPAGMNKWIPATYKKRASLSINSIWLPAKFDWKKNNGDAYDYFVVRSPSDNSPSLFKNSTCNISLVVHIGMWWLYQRAPSC